MSEGGKTGNQKTFSKPETTGASQRRRDSLEGSAFPEDLGVDGTPSAPPDRPSKTPRPGTETPNGRYATLFDPATRNLTPTFQAASRRQEEDMDRSGVRKWLEQESTRPSEVLSTTFDQVSDLGDEDHTDVAVMENLLFSHDNPNESSGLTTPESFQAWEDQVEGAWSTLIMPNVSKEHGVNIDPKAKGVTIKTLILMLQLRESQAREAARRQGLWEAESKKYRGENTMLHKLVNEAESKIRRQRQALNALQEENTHWRSNLFLARDQVAELKKENQVLEDQASALQQEAASQRHTAQQSDAFMEDSTLRYAAAREENRKLDLLNQKLELEKAEVEKRNRVLMKQTALLRSSLSDLQAEEERSGDMWGDFQGIADRLMSQVETMEEESFKCIEEACLEKKQLQAENQALREEIQQLRRTAKPQNTVEKMIQQNARRESIERFSSDNRQRKLRSIQTMPPNWVQYHDHKTGRPYFFNQETATTQWHPPPPTTLPPPPSPHAAQPPSPGRLPEAFPAVNCATPTRTQSLQGTPRSSSMSKHLGPRSKSLSLQYGKGPKPPSPKQFRETSKPDSPKLKVNENGPEMNGSRISEMSVADARALLEKAIKLQDSGQQGNFLDNFLDSDDLMSETSGEVISVHSDNTKALRLMEALESEARKSYEAAAILDTAHQLIAKKELEPSPLARSSGLRKSNSYSDKMQALPGEKQTLKHSSSSKSMPIRPMSPMVQK